MKLSIMKSITAIFVLVSGRGAVQAQSKPDPLMGGFENPPQSPRPRVRWRWMDGNIATEGIKLDLDWMHRIGLAGVTIFEGAIVTPRVVPRRRS